MEQWLLLPWTSKLIDLGIIFLALIAFGGFVIGFVKVFRALTKEPFSVETPIGKMSLGDTDEDGGTHVSVNVNTVEKRDELGDAPVLERYEEEYLPPEGTLPFTEHRFFRVMERAMEGRSVKLVSKHEANEMTEIKNKAFSYFLFQCKTKIFYDMIRDYVDQVLRYRGQREVLVSIVKRTKTAINDYEDMARRAQIDLGNDQILLGVPDLMIDKFREWHQLHVDLLLERVDDILVSTFYASWQMKLISILDEYETIFSVTFDYAKESLIDLNGDLDAALEKNIVTRNIRS